MAAVAASNAQYQHQRSAAKPFYKDFPAGQEGNWVFASIPFSTSQAGEANCW
jgi:hypothetical protein